MKFLNKLNSQLKHILHCILMMIVIIFCEIFTGGIKIDERSFIVIDPWIKYGQLATIIFYLLRFLTFLTLPLSLFNFCGLVLYNAFPANVRLKESPLLSPFICIRVVTRGDFPDLVNANVERNMNICLNTGLEHFIFEVVTDKPINLPKHRRIREIVVPFNYQTKSGAMFKSRALQYCLEDEINNLEDNDWIVHLDEETLLTKNSICGILNFVLDGKHPFGQGLITYANGNVVNWFTTLADSFRVSDDMGKLRLQFKLFHKPLFSWKGSYVVAKLQAEKQVSFDNGLDGSVAEDCFFAMHAFSQGFTFNFIEGEMYEKSPFTLLDFLQQRKRWMQGILLVVHSKRIPMKFKLLLAMSSSVILPLITLNMLFAALYPIPCPNFMDLICGFMAGLHIYMYMFGVLKSFSLYRLGFLRFILCVIAAVCIIPINLIIEDLAVIWGLVGKKYKFYVVQKDIRSLATVNV